jgi:cardiolipin synthase (CMP-forming)
MFSFKRFNFSSFKRNLNVPNLLSFSRIVSSPIIGYYLLNSRYDIPLYLLILHSGSDFLDGWYARKFKALTNLGKILDPLADKMLFFSTFLPLAVNGVIPPYFGAICLLRDTFILIGTAKSILNKKLKPHEIKPTFLSKLNTSLQLVYLLSIILSNGQQFQIEKFQEILKISIVATVFSSTLQYWKILKSLSSNTSFLK